MGFQLRRHRESLVSFPDKSFPMTLFPAPSILLDRPGELLERYAHAELYTTRARCIGAVLGASRGELQEVVRSGARIRRTTVSVVEDVGSLDAILRTEKITYTV